MACLFADEGRGVHSLNHAVDLAGGHLGVERQADALVAGGLALRKMLEPEASRVGRLTMDRHDAAARGDALVEEPLHEGVAFLQKKVKEGSNG